MILFFKPYRVGDWIEFEGLSGRVKEIQIFNTILTTIENKRVIIPNGVLQSNSITNFSAEDKRRIEWIFSISYGDNYDVAKNLLLQSFGDSINAAVIGASGVIGQVLVEQLSLSHFQLLFFF